MSTEPLQELEQAMPAHDREAFMQVSTAVEAFSLATMGDEDIQKIMQSSAMGIKGSEISLFDGKAPFYGYDSTDEGSQNRFGLDQFLGDISAPSVSTLFDTENSASSMEGAYNIGFENSRSNDLLAMDAGETRSLTHEGSYAGQITRIGESGMFVWIRGDAITSGGKSGRLAIDLVQRPLGNEQISKIEQSPSGKIEAGTAAAQLAVAEAISESKTGIDAVNNVDDLAGWLRAQTAGLSRVRPNGVRVAYTQAEVVEQVAAVFDDSHPEHLAASVTGANNLRDAVERIIGDKDTLSVPQKWAAMNTIENTLTHTMTGAEVMGYMQGLVSNGSISALEGSNFADKVAALDAAESSTDLRVAFEIQDAVAANDGIPQEKKKELSSAVNARMTERAQSAGIRGIPVRNENVSAAAVNRATNRMRFAGKGEKGTIQQAPDGSFVVGHDPRQPKPRG